MALDRLGNNKFYDPIIDAKLTGMAEVLFYGERLAKKRFKRRIKELIKTEQVFVYHHTKRGSNAYRDKR